MRVVAWFFFYPAVLLVLIFFLVVLNKPLIKTSPLLSVGAYQNRVNFIIPAITGFSLLILWACYILLDIFSQISSYSLVVRGLLPYQPITTTLTPQFTPTVNSDEYFDILNVALAFDLTPSFFFPFVFIFIFITTLSVLLCLAYSIHEIVSFSLYCAVILFFGIILLFCDHFAIFFFAYEGLLIPSFMILYKFAKTRRCVEASYLMFFWTQFGALFLMFAFIFLFSISQCLTFSGLSSYSFSKFEINLLFILWFIGFGVKIPIWPFYGWLPRAHVEASTNFSIFLSGVLVKFAFFGLLKCLFALSSDVTFFWVIPFLTIGIIDGVFKLFHQIDLKKLVAFATVVEMHWLAICVVSGQSALWLAGFSMLISHALLSTSSFLLVDAINRRFKTRLITEISGLNYLCPKLFLAALINSVIFLGFPGSIFFVAEFLFFSFCLDLLPLLALVLLVLIYLLLPTFFFRSWVNTMFGLSLFIQKPLVADLDFRELLTFLILFSLMFWFGFHWQAFAML